MSQDFRPQVVLGIIILALALIIIILMFIPKPLPARPLSPGSGGQTPSSSQQAGRLFKPADVAVLGHVKIQR